MPYYTIELHVALEDEYAAILAALGAGLRLKMDGATVRRYTVKEAAGPIVEDSPFPATADEVIKRGAALLMAHSPARQLQHPGGSHHMQD